MKTFHICLILLLYSISSFCQEPFITYWAADQSGSSCVNCITIPTIGEGYNYDVDWDNDGIFDEFGLTGSIVHDFGEPGYHTVAIRGDFPRIYFNGIGDARKLRRIIQWGDIKWSGMENAFRGCILLSDDGPDQPDLSNARSLRNCFAECSSFNGYLNDWDVSNITDLSGMFIDADNFNTPLGDWDVSNVVDMSFMFYFCDGRGWEIEDWDVSNVENMEHMFHDADFFNENIGNWNVVKLFKGNHMFLYAKDFDQSLGDWKIPSLMHADHMFSYSGMNCENYSKTLSGWALSIFTPRHLTLGAHEMSYSNAVVGSRNTLLDKNWNIYGDALGSCIVSSEDVQTESLRIFPNPTADNVYFSGNTEFTWQIWDGTGNIVLSGTKSDIINLSNLPPGMYLIEFYDRNGNILYKDKLIKI